MIGISHPHRVLRLGILAALLAVLSLVGLPGPAEEEEPTQGAGPDEARTLFVQLPPRPFVWLASPTDPAALVKSPVELQTASGAPPDGGMRFWIEDEEGAAVFLDVPEPLWDALLRTALRVGGDAPPLH